MKRTDLLMVILLLALTVALAGCLPTLGEPVMPEPPTAPPPPTALPVVAVVPPPIPHTLGEARRDCLLCHAAGVAEAPPVPADDNHEDAEELCRTCHALLSQPAPPAVAPPDIPHDLVGREDCLMCHKMGIAFAPRIPENHVGLSAELCQTCHLAALATPLPEEPRVVGIMPPQVPHSIEGRDDCRLCHETGVGGAPQFPPDHVDRANEVCLVCHAAASEPTEAPVSPTEEPTTAPTEATSAAGDATKGVTLYATHCAACHGNQGQGTAIVKEPLNSATFLASRSDEDLRQTIADGVPGTAMSSYSNKLSSKDIADIIAFFRSWQH